MSFGTKGKIKKINPDKLPVYEIMVDEFDETGISLISLVQDPAIMVKGMAFNKSSMMSFKEVGDKQIIVGPALIPDMRIYREDDKFGQYYVVFSKETIAKMVEKFNKYGSNRKINIDHSNMMVDAFIIEDWITEDAVYDKSRKYGIEVPVGTYMIMVKIEDKNFWENEVKGNGKFGFSIEGLLGQQLVSLKREATIDDLTEEDLIQLFSAIFIADSSNVDRVKYFEETRELVVKFNDGSYYTYSDIDESVFNSIIEGDATCRTEGQNEFGEWEIGKTPSVGAAIWKYLIDRGNLGKEGGSFYSNQFKMEGILPSIIKNNN
jgi:hypothetical protein